MYKRSLKEKLKEALKAVLPIMAIVLLLSFTLTPMPKPRLKRAVG